MNKPASRFGISAVTVSVEMADKNYGSGQSDFMSVGSRLPETAEGLDMSIDDVIQDGLHKYFAAWQTLMQAAWASGRIDRDIYETETKNTLRRLKKVRALYKRVLQADSTV